jgi:hypothetical protein
MKSYKCFTCSPGLILVRLSVLVICVDKILSIAIAADLIPGVETDGWTVEYIGGLSSIVTPFVCYIA